MTEIVPLRPLMLISIMDIPAFTEKVAEILRRRFPDEEFISQADEGVIRYHEIQCGMDNLHRQYMQRGVTDEDFEQIVVEKIGNVLVMSRNGEWVAPHEWEQAKGRLRLQLFHRRIDQDDLTLKFPFSPSVYFSIVIDSPTGYAYVSQTLADAWGQTALDLIEIAQQNLLDASESMQMMFTGGDTPLLIIQTVDGYDAARVLVPEIRQRVIEQLTGEPDGEIYVGVPNRDFFIAWSTQVPEEMHETLRTQITTDARSQPYPLCETPLLVTREKIVPVA
jgi:hypothetical protein